MIRIIGLVAALAVWAQAGSAEEPVPGASEGGAEGAAAGVPAGVPAVAAKLPPRDPGKGAVTNLPLPRFVTLKTGEGNARRGPGLTHRIDWVFTTAGMPLRLTAEFENWRRVEDADGIGGWVHYTLLSGVRSVLVFEDMAQFRARPDAGAEVMFQTELGVIGRLRECSLEWCEVTVSGERGWVRKTSLWGVAADEIIE